MKYDDEVTCNAPRISNACANLRRLSEFKKLAIATASDGRKKDNSFDYELEFESEKSGETHMDKGQRPLLEDSVREIVESNVPPIPSSI